MTMKPLLEGIQVLDFGRYLAGPYCAALLAEFGANVIRVEKTDGGEDRDVMPIAADGSGAMFLQVNRNKRSMTLDLTTPEGQEILRRLLTQTDVVVTNTTPKSLRRLGLDYESLRAIKPDIILTSASAFGDGGPKSDAVGFDGIGQAISGAIYVSGFPNQPVKPNVPYVDFGTALACAFGTMAALLHRSRSGEGQEVHASLLTTAYTFLSPLLVEEAVISPGRKANGNRNETVGPSDVFQTTDGWIIVQVIGQPLFQRWANLVGLPHLIEEPKFSNDSKRGLNGAELSQYMAEWCASRTTAQALAALDAVKIPAGPVRTPRQALEDDHALKIGIFNEMDYPGLPRPAPLIRAPVQLSRTPGTLRRRPPTLGEHTDAILTELSYGKNEIAEFRKLKII